MLAEPRSPALLTMIAPNMAVCLRPLACFALVLAAPRAIAENAFLNLSTRGRVGSGENVLIGGLVVESRSNVLIRGMGPSLGPLGVTEPLHGAQITLFNRDGRQLATNTDWRLAIPATLAPDEPPFPGYDATHAPVEMLRTVMARVGAFAPTGFADAALYLELAPGTYTVHLDASDGEAGVGLLESYLVSHEIDPFTPAGRVRSDPGAGYAPPLDGLAPASPIPESGTLDLNLNFSSAVAWNHPGVPHTTVSRLTLPFAATGTRDLQHGRTGVADSRAWLVSPHYTKTGPDFATVANLATPGTSATSILEEIQLTFVSLRKGTFIYMWRDSDAIGSGWAGTATGSFTWTRQVQNLPSTEAGSRFFRRFSQDYADGRPSPNWAVSCSDQGAVLAHGHGPAACDANGAREPIVQAVGGGYVLHYDGCAVGGWRACRAVSTDLVNWTLDGPVLELGPLGSIDAGAAASPWVIEQAGIRHMFYLATPQTTGAPDYIPFVPYVTRRATASSPLGPWTKQTGTTPFDPSPGTYYAGTAAPGHVFAHSGEFLQVFSAGATSNTGVFERTLGLARTADLTAAWTIDPAPLLPPSEQIENSSLYFEPANGLWFLFTNHVGVTAAGTEYTDEIWMYWSPDPTRFDPLHKAVVLDPGRSSWSKWVLGMPSVVRVGDRLAMLYDGCREPGYGHMRRDIALAWLDLPLQPPF